MKNTTCFWIELRKDKILFWGVLISLISALRIIFLPLGGDEITYAEIARNIMNRGWFAFQELPSTLTPVMPIILSAFYIETLPQYGLFLAKLLNLVWLWWAIKYMFLFFKSINLPVPAIITIISLTLVNTNFIAMSLTLYPDMFIFSMFWMFIYRLSMPIKSMKSWIFLVLPLMILVLTRYVYAVFGLPILFVFLKYLKELYQQKSFQKIGFLFLYTLICLIPLLFWFKYVLTVESVSDANLSYFNRFKNNSLIYNFQAGIGIIKHEETKNINGLPAFSSLFLPITGFRSWMLSSFLLVVFWLGYIFNREKIFYNYIIFIIVLLTGGLAIAGTGFSRYWLPMIPLFLLGFYEFFKWFKIDEKFWIIGVKLIVLMYVINELRIDWLVVQKFSS